MRIKETFVDKIRDVVAACPYTIVGKKIFGNKERSDDKNPYLMNFQEQIIIKRIKLGRNIALIGVFCPLFWIALFSGASWDMVAFNGIHSGIVIALGYVILIKSRFDLARFQKAKENDGPSGPE